MHERQPPVSSLRRSPRSSTSRADREPPNEPLELQLPVDLPEGPAEVIVLVASTSHKSNTVHVSAASAWEIVVKHALGKVPRHDALVDAMAERASTAASVELHDDASINLVFEGGLIDTRDNTTIAEKQWTVTREGEVPAAGTVPP